MYIFKISTMKIKQIIYKRKTFHVSILKIIMFIRVLLSELLNLYNCNVYYVCIFIIYKVYWLLEVNAFTMARVLITVVYNKANMSICL